MVLASSPSGIVTLLTDFGIRDPFVGVMKGVILGRHPRVSVVDLTHEIEPQDVREAAFWLERSFEWFPRGTVHLAVVDPTVGTDRAALVAYAHGHWFVAPDNGLIHAVVEADSAAEVHCIDSQRLGAADISRTFHGRDLFAPAAADLASARCQHASLGAPHPHLSRLSGGAALWPADSGRGVVVTVDRFGNLITNIPVSRSDALVLSSVEIGSQCLRVVGTYAEASPGELVAVLGSFGTLELACRNGSAAVQLGMGKGAAVAVLPPKS